MIYKSGPNTKNLKIAGVEVLVSQNEISIYDHKEEISRLKGERICTYLCDEGFLEKNKRITYHILRPQ